MTNLELSFSPYKIKLRTPFSTGKGIFTERNGFILTLKDENRISGTGDVSPFPEFGSESIEESEKALEKLKLKIDVDYSSLHNSLNNILNDYKALPALRHGLEQSILNLICKERNIALADLLKIKLKKKVNVNAAIGFMNAEKAAAKAQELINKGIKTIKIKTGRDENAGGFSLDKNVIEVVRKIAGDDIKIRIDSNGRWDLKSAIKNLNETEIFNIEYAEQPVNSIEDFIDLKRQTNVPLAADESIRDIKSAEEFINKSVVDFIILKPMMIGGLIPTLEIIELAEKNNITPVITSSFESAVGKANAVFAAASVQKKIAHGLSVSQYYESDIAVDNYPVKNGTIVL